ncbi:glycosyltransferase family 90 protein [Amorphotheca resinae ATCC 22711]|uniref:Glycosyltransferase family 90 protein n=1 Tax=Amorphotheca resinae ATCC 22711 TaxID=857342 RepID=A0A2T3AWS6_AMORE|nr:glycosyltransferase family 90 protein [Amorphotheca resinae ATCC 22711]PSS13111.1 glycosyltransferase family 90 protein [Amorphotheca resinae ATCC 22711]
MLTGTDARSTIKDIHIIPGKSKSDVSYSPSWHADINDEHPIAGLMREADKAWNAYEDSRSTTFRETVAKYRKKYGRHPPPGFRDWYRFARNRNVHNVDDFEQIMDDLRPFWGVEPSTIRSLAAHMSENPDSGVSGLHIRNKKIWKLTNANWRMDTFAKLVEKFVKYLPDMDIAMNRLDQPRVVVPWDDMQALLAKEAESRRILPEVLPEWTKDMEGLLKDNDTAPLITDPQWFSAPGQQYMLIAKEACPPESHARVSNSSSTSAESLYKDPRGGFITNFNRSSDLCTVGPEIQDKHGFLFAPSTVVASRQLLPIFGECKVNVNSDILFPANMYYANDDRYTYNGTYDYDWDDKEDQVIWRGVTSGGTNTADNWEKMHRQRLVLMTNETVMADKEVRIMSLSSPATGQYENFEHFHPSAFAKEHTDVGFTEALACVPDCSFYDNIWAFKNMTTLSEQFISKFLVDVDGHSFSGRWHAFLQSKSLGIKSTIFREWHDSRLFAWRHFVPLDNRFDELYSILTYFIGLGSPSDAGKEGVPYVQRHDFEGRKLGQQGREWASKVLRPEDIEIYTFRLLLEYARVIDDNRDRIGYSGDGSELDKYDSKHPISGMHGRR